MNIDTPNFMIEEEEILIEIPEKTEYSLPTDDEEDNTSTLSDRYFIKDKKASIIQPSTL